MRPLIILLFLCFVSSVHAQTPSAADWVEQLGDARYAVRKQAARRLLQLGEAAFDDLLKAQQHPKLEVALQAKRLLYQLPIAWARDEDSHAVRELLQGYQHKPSRERLNLIEQLASLENAQGAPAIRRIARYEFSEQVSKRAALAAMRLIPENAAQRKRLAEALQNADHSSRRTGVLWLEAFAKTLEAPEQSMALWEKLSHQEERLLQNKPEQSHPEIVRDLLRWRVKQLERLKRTEGARTLLAQMVETIDGETRPLIEMTDWLIVEENWEWVDWLAERFPQRFEEDPMLTYRLAEARLQAGKKEQAEQTARQALLQKGREIDDHALAGYWLKGRGRHAWAEKEYRRAIEQSPKMELLETQARISLSELLHDQQRNREAAEILQPLAESTHHQITFWIRRAGRTQNAVAARMHYFSSLHHAKSGEPEKQQEQLQKCLEKSEEEIDGLIAYYRSAKPGSPQRIDAVARIRIIADDYMRRIRQRRRQANEAAKERERADRLAELAVLCNQIAWLIGNTEGDYQQALQFSRKSLELRPKTAGFLDTLGRCYYALGDYPNAVKYQRQAVEQDPHNGQMQRQLKLFEKAL